MKITAALGALMGLIASGVIAKPITNPDTVEVPSPGSATSEANVDWDYGKRDVEADETEVGADWDYGKRDVNADETEVGADWDYGRKRDVEADETEVGADWDYGRK